MATFDTTAAVLARVKARRAKWHTEILDELPPADTHKETTIVGGFSHCLMESRRRLLLRKVCIETDEGLETPSSLARDYLLAVYQRSPRAKRTQIEAIRRTLGAHPALAIPTTFSKGYYVDIVSTYWSVMQVVGWNLDYWPGRWLARGRPPFDFPWPKHKIARNCLVSAGLSGTTTIYKPGRGFLHLTTGNPLANLQLFRLLVDVLNGIAWECKQAGAIYINVDGYIMRNFRDMEKAIEIVASWGLTPGIKDHGAGWVRGPGFRAIGNTRSAKNIRNTIPHDSVIDRADREWLKVRFSKLAREARVEGLFDQIESSRQKSEDNKQTTTTGEKEK